MSAEPSKARIVVTPLDLPVGDAAHSIEDRLFREIVALRERGVGAALATVIAVRGSAPAREPMKILVRADGSTLGSVGGGCLEEEVKRQAQRVIEEERPCRVAMALNAEDSVDGALICGGEVEVYLEPITAPPLVLFGGGHVGRAVATLAARVGFRLLVTDDRPEYASCERFPMAAETRVDYRVDLPSLMTSLITGRAGAAPAPAPTRPTTAATAATPATPATAPAAPTEPPGGEHA